jgi:protein-disulfide isomerase
VGCIVGVVAGFLALLLFVMVGAGALVAFRAKKKARATAVTAARKSYWSDAASPVPVSYADPMRGDRDALVTVVVFSDLQCPFCKRLETTLDDVRSRYGSDVRVLWKNEPLAFHHEARPAAEAAQGVFDLAGNEAFWRFQQKAFTNQTSLSRSSYESWASAEGVDPRTFSSGLTSHRWAFKVDEDHRLASRLGVTGVPATFVNGIKLSGAQPLSAFEKVVDDELVKARAELASGTPRDRIYVERSKANFAAAPPAVTPAFPVAPPTATVKPIDPDEATVFPIPVGSSPARGPATALVTIVEFGDYQCPFTKRAEISMERLRKEYGSEVRIVFKQQPLSFHPRAEPAAELALEARAQRGDVAYFLAHDKLFAAQPRLENADLLDIAKDIGLDDGRVSTAILTRKYKPTIDAESALGKGFGATGTPTFFVNGRRLTGAQPYDKFKDLVDEELPKARARVAAGTPRSRLYDELVGLK